MTRRSASGFFSLNKAPNGHERFAAGGDFGVRNVMEWAQTGRGGRQLLFEMEDPPACMSLYGLCE